MMAAAHVIGPGVSSIFSILCKVDCEELKGLPRRDPLIIVMNHIHFLEDPLLHSLLYPRDISGFAEADDEIMLSPASLMSPKYHGYYADRAITARQLIPAKVLP